MSHTNERRELSNLETALKHLMPKDPAFDRDRVLFHAGRAAGRRVIHKRAFFSGILGVCIGLLAAYPIFHYSVQPVERVLEANSDPQSDVQNGDEPQQQERPNIPSSPLRSDNSVIDVAANDQPLMLPPGTYPHLRRQVLRWGPEMLPLPSATTEAFPQPPMQMRPWQRESISNQNNSFSLNLFSFWQ